MTWLSLNESSKAASVFDTTLHECAKAVSVL